MFEILSIMGLLIFIVAGIFASEMDSAMMSVATFVIGLITLEYGFGLGIWSMITGNFLVLIGFIILFVAVGAAYTALWRWPEYIRTNKDSIMEKYARWSRGLRPSDDNSFDSFLDSSDYTFNASQHKERLGVWVGMWPFSLFWELLRKPAIWLWNNVYASLGEMFQKIGRNTARKLHDKG
jgi:hypothetical protein